MRFICSYSLILVIGLRSVVFAQAVDPAANVKDIESYVACLNQVNPAGQPSDISKAVQCLPRGCKITLTMGVESAQAACSLAGCQLPRILINCPGPSAQLRLRPSFLLCPVNSRPANAEYGLNRVEVADDTAKVVGNKGKMRMADIEIHPGANYAAIAAASVISGIDPLNPGRGTKACNRCHTSEGLGAGNPQPELSRPIQAFGKSQDGTNLLPYIIATDEPGIRVSPTAKGTDGRVLQAQNLTQICNCIQMNQAQIKLEANSNKLPVNDRNPNLDTAMLLSLCRNLETYSKERSCGKRAFADGTPASCGAVRGGGKFLNNGAVTIFNFDLSGEVKRPGGGNFEFVDIDGDLTSFDYNTRTLIDGVILTSTSGFIAGNGDITVNAVGTAKVNGVQKNVTVSIKKTAGVLTFEIRDAQNMMLLASGTGEAGRSSLNVSFNP